MWLAPTMRLSKNNCVKTNKDRHILSSAQIFGRHLDSGGIRLMRIFAEVPWGGGVKLQWGCRKRQFSAILMAIFSDTLEMRPVLLYGDMQSVIGFSVIPKCMTLNDLDWLFCVKFCFCWLRPCDYGNNCVKTNKDRHTLSAVQYLWQGLLVSGNIRFVRIFGQVL